MAGKGREGEEERVGRKGIENGRKKELAGKGREGTGMALSSPRQCTGLDRSIPMLTEWRGRGRKEGREEERRHGSEERESIGVRSYIEVGRKEGKYQ